MLFRRTAKELFGGGYVTPFTQEKINGSTLFMDRAIQVSPLTLYLNVGLIYTPGVRPQAARTGSSAFQSPARTAAPIAR